MNRINVISVLLAVLVSQVICAERREDSYLDAFHDSSGKHSGPGFTDNFAASYPNNNFGDYNAPNPVYGAPTYGPPPTPTYGPPHHNYHPYPVYGPPPHHGPRGDWFLNKFSFKFDLFTLGKILIKLILFKKIVKFFGIICLLLFLPTLIEKKKELSSGDHNDEGGDMFRNFKGMEPSQTLNELTAFVMTSIEAFSKQQSTTQVCPAGSLSCRFSRMFDAVDKKYPIRRISKWYHGSVNSEVEHTDMVVDSVAILPSQTNDNRQ